MHLFLRVSDVLLNLLLADIRREDGKLKKGDNLIKFESFLCKHCTAQCNIEIENNKCVIKPDLQGPEKLRLLKNIDIPQFLPTNSNANSITNIWATFFKLYCQILHDDWSHDTIEIFKTELNLRLDNFTDIYQTKFVTPYMHAFVTHVPEIIVAHGSIAQFTQQGLERLNSECKSMWYSGTNLKGKAMQQLMYKMKRRQYYVDNENTASMHVPLAKD